MAEHKHAEVLRAIADGKEVEWQRETCIGCWHEMDSAYNPIDDWELKWRVKPEPLSWLEGQDFYEVCQQYRHAKDGCVGGLAPYVAFQQLKDFIRMKVELIK